MPALAIRSILELSSISAALRAGRLWIASGEIGDKLRLGGEEGGKFAAASSSKSVYHDRVKYR